MRPTTTPGAAHVTRDGKPASPILANTDEAFGWLLGHQPMSTDWAIRYEGYAVERIPAEPWTNEETERAQLRYMAAAAFRHGHSNTFRDADDEELTRDNCGACALAGWGEQAAENGGPRRPAYANWGRVYVEASRPIPARWRTAFHAVLNADDNPAHHDALLRSLATWGVRFTD
jgi:hypothetical protein